jgi:DNA polymerase
LPVAQPAKSGGAERYLPERRSLPALREAAAACRGCDLWRDATQTVFGEGPTRARLLAVGEQPGDREDLAGHPFVGPAGRVLEDGYRQAGIDPAIVYTTNIVKHFKWERRGKRRIHKTPSRREVVACQPWFAAELEAVRPRLVLVLGATAGRAVLGSGFRVNAERGRVQPGMGGVPTLATVHPSAILRATDGDRAAAMAAFVADLKVARRAISPDG